ncbi:MAG: CpsD/CapB family tyrosine-protein kinase [Acidobacteriaceae bacterium]|nr:CpsD/CapB family tyrosine-protein kinase [Acidobacteriaceae bacterium]MBV9781637.1 CpsD/CapB family tyrosine-protein kinase [Acidobacteriaceae bacterium]
MSRIHEALRKAAQENIERPRPSETRDERYSQMFEKAPPSATALVETVEPEEVELDEFNQIIRNAREVAFDPANGSLLVNPAKPREAPSEEFRSLRTRLNHLQTLQSLHTLVVTSASPAEGKSFTAANLAITQAQLSEKRVLLADFDLRRPNVHTALQIDSSPGVTDYLAGQAAMEDVVRKVAGMNLWLMTAGESVPNPLELLNLKECKNLIDQLRTHFDWVILDTPPLLSAADANLLATMCDGTILVVRIGTTTYDAVTRALQSLCENNVLGVVVNGSPHGDLGKYSYQYGYDSGEQGKRTQTEAGTLYWV